MDTAKVFTTGRSQAIRIPKEYRFNVDEVYINKIGDIITLTPVKSLTKAFEEAQGLFSADFFEEGMPEEIPSKRIKL